MAQPVSIILDCPVWTAAQPTDNNTALFICARRHFGSERWKFFVFIWRNSTQCARASSFTRFLDHIQRRATVGRTPLDEWSARRSWKFFSKTKSNHCWAKGCTLSNSTPSKCGTCVYTTLCTCKQVKQHATAPTKARLWQPTENQNTYFPLTFYYPTNVLII